MNVAGEAIDDDDEVKKSRQNRFSKKLSEKLGCEEINLSASGGSNQRIFRTTFDWIQKNKEKLESELGDIMWYWAQACMALHLDPYTVLKKNIKKLESRYPGGKFSVEKSEKR